MFEGQYKIVSQNQTNDSIIMGITPRYTNQTIQSYTLILRTISNSIGQFIIKETNSTRFELRNERPFPFHNSSIPFFSPRLYSFLIQVEPFSLSILRKTTKEIIFQTPVKYPFAFLSNFIQLIAFIPTANIYGLGERTTNFKLKSGVYTLFNKDNPGIIDYGVGNNNNRYGSHPMYLMREQSGYYHINYLRNGFPMDIKLNTKGKVIKYYIAGRILNFSLFFGDKTQKM